ncbi:hypothetical protein BGZ59_000070 [Podila verticillata]|nr:hypothetical protein BGZ59_000070 [Podila verticillata]KFH65677.1 hypothetical protein MVEG_09150 [Podila verticillata NRRL 6337]
MDQDDEERQMAEAIRLSLLESGTPVENAAAAAASSFSRNLNRSSMHPSQPISLSDDDDDLPILGREYPSTRQPYSNSGIGIDSSDDYNIFSGVPAPRRGAGMYERNRDQRRAETDGAQSDEDEEEKQLKLALELSLQEVKARTENGKPTASTTAKEESTIGGTPIGSILGLSRAEMERQRQERLLARKRPNTEIESSSTSSNRHDAKRLTGDKIPSDKQLSDSPSTATRFSKFAAPSISTITPIVSPSAPEPVPTVESSTGRTSVSKYTSLKPLRDSAESSTPTFSKTSSITSSHYMKPTQTPAQLEIERLQTLADLYPIHYSEATFKNTYIKGGPKGSNTVRIDDLIDREYIQKAVLTAFQLDPVWLERYLPRTVPQCLVTHWDQKRGESPGFRTEGKVTELHPPLTGYGSFHPKMMLLFYVNFCRVVVSSANLVSHDWEEMVNTLYVQDFPMLPERVSDPNELGSFGSTLYNFMKVMTLPDKILQVVRCVDFSSAKVHLIPTVQGSFPVYADHTYGIARFAKVMEDLNPSHQSWSMEYQTSSLGRLNLKFLTEFDRASRGYPVRARSNLDPEELMPSIKIVFPTEQTVQASRNGEMGAGTVCFQEQYWKEPSFPRPVLHDFECAGSMKGSLMHTKLVLARRISASNFASSSSTLQSSDKTPAGWVYVGSANFTESAWGGISQKGGRKKAAPVTSSSVPTPAATLGLQVTMRNWELGVVYLIESEQEVESLQNKRSARDRGEGINFFGPLPVPFKRPVRQYTSRDKPWFMVG